MELKKKIAVSSGGFEGPNTSGVGRPQNRPKFLRPQNSFIFNLF